MEEVILHRQEKAVSFDKNDNKFIFINHTILFTNLKKL